MCKFCQGVGTKLCNECAYLLDRYTYNLKLPVGKRDHELVDRVNKQCKANHQEGLYVPQVYFQRHKSELQVAECVQCLQPFNQLLKEKSCQTCVKAEKKYRVMISQALKKGYLTEGAAAMENMYEARYLNGQHVPRLYLRRKVTGEVKIL